MRQKFLYPALIFCIVALSQQFAHAVDLSIGVSTWYTGWEMKTAAGNGYSETTDNMKSSLMFGPVAAVKFSQDWSLSSALLYTEGFEMSDQSGGTNKMKRLDWDTLLNYNINSYFKIFAGAKYMDFTFDGGDHWSTGPGLGLGLTLPVAGSLYFIANASGMYLFGNHKDPGGSTKMVEYGFNAAANLAYYIESISLTLSVGYRFQFFISDYSDSSSNNNESTFSGFTASVIYSF